MQIDRLIPFTMVVLRYDNHREPYTEQATFIGVEGEGEDREATFHSPVETGPTASKDVYEWKAYRYKNRWVYGSSCDRLSVVGVHEGTLFDAAVEA